ncbi:MAG: hypothetical protein K0B08_12330, partial [Bacteroidales bacterium]|nr:hypothetical protein [Bacteroidales bacterium]
MILPHPVDIAHFRLHKPGLALNLNAWPGAVYAVDRRDLVLIPGQKRPESIRGFIVKTHHFEVSIVIVIPHVGTVEHPKVFPGGADLCSRVKDVTGLHLGGFDQAFGYMADLACDLFQVQCWEPVVPGHRGPHFSGIVAFCTTDHRIVKVIPHLA